MKFCCIALLLGAVFLYSRLRDIWDDSRITVVRESSTGRQGKSMVSEYISDQPRPTPLVHTTTTKVKENKRIIIRKKKEINIKYTLYTYNKQHDTCTTITTTRVCIQLCMYAHAHARPYTRPNLDVYTY